MTEYVPTSNMAYFMPSNLKYNKEKPPWSFVVKPKHAGLGTVTEVWQFWVLFYITIGIYFFNQSFSAYTLTLIIFVNLYFKIISMHIYCTKRIKNLECYIRFDYFYHGNRSL